MSERSTERTPLLLLPFVLVWRLLGLVMMIAGVVTTMSVVGAPLGIPLSILGFLLLIRALF